VDFDAEEIRQHLFPLLYTLQKAGALPAFFMGNRGRLMASKARLMGNRAHVKAPA
jgi:hypothetical protein